MPPEEWNPPDEGSTTLSVLLQGFFEYYTEFDWDLNSINIRGPATYKNKNCPMEIIDPFETSRNLGGYVKAETLPKITEAFTHALEKGRKGKVPIYVD